MQNPDIDTLLKLAVIIVTVVSLKPYPFLAKWEHFRVGVLVDSSP